MKTLSAFLLAAAVSLTASGQTLFTDDFESGLGSWFNLSATYPVSVSTEQNIVPSGGSQSLLFNNSGSRAYRNLGTEVSGTSSATWYIYDDTQTRLFGEVRSYEGNGYAVGALQNLLAAGKYNSVTLTGETYDATKYQGRISATGFGWFNLNLEGVPSRSAGWHRFDVERLPGGGGNTVNFYVDGILGRSFAGVPDFAWDSLVFGLGAGTTAGNGWVDGVSVSAVPEPSTCALLALVFGLTGWRFRRR